MTVEETTTVKKKLLKEYAWKTVKFIPVAAAVCIAAPVVIPAAKIAITWAPFAWTAYKVFSYLPSFNVMKIGIGSVFTLFKTKKYILG